MLKQSLFKLLPVILLSVAQCAGMMNLGCELSPPKVMAQQPQGDDNAKLEKLIQQLDSADDTERNNAAIALGKMGASARSALSTPSVVRALFRLLRSDSEYIRVSASLAISQIVKSDRADVTRLFPLFKHPNPDVRASAVAKMGSIELEESWLQYLLESGYGCK